MQIFVSKTFSSKLMERTEEQLKMLNDRINELKSMNKTDIINREDVAELTRNKGVTVYAYHMQDSTFVLFAFKEKNEIVLLDEFKLIGKNEVESLIYGKLNNNDNEANASS